EPSTIVICLLAICGGAFSAVVRFYREKDTFIGRVVRSRYPVGLAVAFFVIAWCSDSFAVLPPSPVLDRNYRFGDADSGPVANGNFVNVTFDSAGLPGMNQLIDLTAQNGPKYVQLPTVSGGPIPVRPDGGTGFAIRLNPNSTFDGQYLATGFG